MLITKGPRVHSYQVTQPYLNLNFLTFKDSVQSAMGYLSLTVQIKKVNSYI